MAVYLDFFLQIFAFALAWCLAMAISGAVLIIGLFAWVRAPGFWWRPRR